MAATKNRASISTIEGPPGVSNETDRNRPSATDSDAEDGGEQGHLLGRLRQRPGGGGRHDQEGDGQQHAHDLDGDRHHQRQHQHEDELDALDLGAFGRRQVLVHGQRQQRPPHVDQRRQRQRAAEIDPARSAAVMAKMSPNRKRHQVELGAAHQRGRRSRRRPAPHAPAGPAANSNGTTCWRLSTTSSTETASVTTSTLAVRSSERARPSGHADEARLRHRLAVVGHAPPHHEAAERRRDDRQAPGPRAGRASGRARARQAPFSAPAGRCRCAAARTAARPPDRAGGRGGDGRGRRRAPPAAPNRRAYSGCCATDCGTPEQHTWRLRQMTRSLCAMTTCRSCETSSTPKPRSERSRPISV